MKPEPWPSDKAWQRRQRAVYEQILTEHAKSKKTGRKCRTENPPEVNPA